MGGLARREVGGGERSGLEKFETGGVKGCEDPRPRVKGATATVDLEGGKSGKIN